MGPSGSGKTTLLDCLAYRKRQGISQQGEITINDGFETSSTSMRNVSSYVEQEDTLIGSLTVRETLSFAARLSLSRYSVVNKLTVSTNVSQLYQIPRTQKAC